MFTITSTQQHYVFLDYFLAQRSDFLPWLHGNITAMTGQQEVAPSGQEIAQHIPPHPDVSLRFLFMLGLTDKIWLNLD